MVSVGHACILCESVLKALGRCGRHTFDILDSLTAVITVAVGNEADVEVYANYTGFMWETAREFKALVVFAEVCCHAVLPQGFTERLVAHSKTASLPCKCACYVQQAFWDVCKA